jgi:hypothetical protein
MIDRLIDVCVCVCVHVCVCKDRYKDLNIYCQQAGDTEYVPILLSRFGNKNSHIQFENEQAYNPRSVGFST